MDIRKCEQCGQNKTCISYAEYLQLEDVRKHAIKKEVNERQYKSVFKLALQFIDNIKDDKQKADLKHKLISDMIDMFRKELENTFRLLGYHANVNIDVTNIEKIR